MSADRRERPTAQHGRLGDAVGVAPLACWLDGCVRRGQHRLRLVPALVQQRQLDVGGRKAGDDRAPPPVGSRRGLAPAPDPASPGTRRQRSPAVAGDGGVVAERAREGVVVAVLPRGTGDAELGLFQRTREEPWWSRLQASSSFDSSSRADGASGTSRSRSSATSRARVMSPRTSYTVARQSSTVTSGSWSRSSTAELSRAHERVLRPRGRPAVRDDECLAQEQEELELVPGPFGTRGQQLQRTQRGAKVPCGVLVGAPAERQPRRELQVAHCPLPAVASDEVVGELGGRVGGPLAVRRLEPRRCARAGRRESPRAGAGRRPPGTARAGSGNRSVAVPSGSSAGPLRCSSRPRRERGRPLLGGPCRRLERGRERHAVELGARDTRRAEEGPVLRREAREVALDQRSQRVGDVAGELVRAREQARLAVLMLDGACGQPGVDEVLQEERVAAAQPAEQPNRLGGELAAAEAGGHVRPHCVTAKGAERQLRAAAPDPEALDQLAHMVVAARASASEYVLITSRRAGSSRRASSTRSRVAWSDQWRSSSTSTTGRSSASASSASTTSRSIESLVAPSRRARSQSISAQEPRHLHQPGRRAAVERGHDCVAARLAGHSPERVQHRHERLAGTTLLDAAAVADARRRLGRLVVQQRGDECRLPGARLTFDERDSTPARCRVGEEGAQVGELSFASDDPSRP